jgi:Fe-Mn family superoxide dismutase
MLEGTGHLAGGAPILLMDMFEHAYMIDYGLRKADYVEGFLKNVNWAIVQKRMAK